MLSPRLRWNKKKSNLTKENLLCFTIFFRQTYWTKYKSDILWHFIIDMIYFDKDLGHKYFNIIHHLWISSKFVLWFIEIHSLFDIIKAFKTYKVLNVLSWYVFGILFFNQFWNLSYSAIHRTSLSNSASSWWLICMNI